MFVVIEIDQATNRTRIPNSEVFATREDAEALREQFRIWQVESGSEVEKRYVVAELVILDEES